MIIIRVQINKLNNFFDNVLTNCGGAVASLFAVLEVEWFGFEPWREHDVVFLAETLYSQSASFHPDV